MTAAELEARLAEIARSSEQATGVGEYEHLLEGLTEFLRSGHVRRDDANALLVPLAHPQPRWGAIEVVEFTTHQLRWPEVRGELIALERDGASTAVRHNARQLLQAFDDDWDGREIYSAYR